MRKELRKVLPLLAAVALVLMAGVATAQDAIYFLGYYANAKVSGAPDAQLRLTNDGRSIAINGDVIRAAIYVFNNDEQMEECCACSISPDGYLDLDVSRDLLGNPLTPEESTSRGIIKVISADSDAEANSLTPGTGVRGWLTQIQNGASSGSYAVTQSDLKDSVLSASESSNLQTTCGFVLSLGSGAGACSCGDAGH